MRIEDIKALPDAELAQFIEIGQFEQKTREDRKRQETIARIKQLASSVGVAVTINGQRGRPAKHETKPKHEVNVQKGGKHD